MEFDWEAGEYFLKALAEKNINLPVIICSTRNYRIPGAYGSVWFSDLSDWEMDLRSLINRLSKSRRMVSVPIASGVPGQGHADPPRWLRFP